MRKILNKINDIVNDIEAGWMTEEDALDFFRGYLIAMEEVGNINGADNAFLMKFLNELIHNRIFTQKEGD